MRSSTCLRLLTMEPATTLDARFSDPGSTPTTWVETKRVLEEAQLFWVTTVRADGRPHSTPLVALWLDDSLHFCTGPEEQKAVNLRANDEVLLTTGCNRWDDGVDVIVEGAAEPVTDRTILERLAVEWQSKWDGRWQFEVVDGGFRHEAGTALVFAVKPTKVIAFGKGTYTHTSHRF